LDYFMPITCQFVLFSLANLFILYKKFSIYVI